MDRLARQHSIYRAVSPHLVRLGPSRLTMRTAADAAHLSVSGLGHYFPTKRDLLLHGLRPDALTRVCTVFRASLSAHPGWSIQECEAAYLEHAVALLDFVRPSLKAALTLGLASTDSLVAAVMAADIGESVFRRILPELPADRRHELGRALRRVGLGAALDPTASASEIKGHLRAVLRGYRAEIGARTSR